MSKLYVKMDSDTRKNTVTSQGNNYIQVDFLYGSKTEHKTISTGIYQKDGKFSFHITFPKEIDRDDIIIKLS